MKLLYTRTALTSLSRAPVNVRKSFYKQSAFLLHDLHHPSLRTKKYTESDDRWQGRVNKAWRFYFRIIKDTYVIEDIIPHPK